MYIYIYIEREKQQIHPSENTTEASCEDPPERRQPFGTYAHTHIRSVFKISCLFLRPRLWRFEIRDSTDK